MSRNQNPFIGGLDEATRRAVVDLMRRVDALDGVLDGAKVDRAGDTMTGPLFLPAGTAADPSLSWSADPDSGFRSVGSGDFIAVSNGVDVVRFFDNGLIVGTAATGDASVRSPDAVATPGFTWQGDTDTGMFWDGTNSIGWATSGVERMQLGTSNLNFAGAVTGAASIKADGAGGATDAAYQFGGDANTGLYRKAADNWGLTSGSVVNLSGTTTYVYVDVNQLSFPAVTKNDKITLYGSGDSYSMGVASNTFVLQSNRYFRFYEDGDTGVALQLDTYNNPVLTLYNDTASENIQFYVDTTWSRIHATQDIYINQPINPTYVRNYNDGAAGAPALSFRNDTNSGLYRAAEDNVAMSVGGAWTQTWDDNASNLLRGGAAFSTVAGAGSQAQLRIQGYDTSSDKGKAVGIAYMAQYSTDRHVYSRVWQPSGDRLGFRNWENTAWVALDASAFTISSSKREKRRIRTARKERGLLDFAVPGERSLAFDQYKKLRPVLFDDQQQHHDLRWDCDIHDDRNDCEDARPKCPNAESKPHQHLCDDLDCSGSNAHPCWDIEQHVDRVGLIAEEVAEVYPKAVPKMVGLVADTAGTDEDWQAGGVMGIDTHMLHVETINVVQYLIETVEELQAEVDRLKRGGQK